MTRPLIPPIRTFSQTELNDLFIKMEQIDYSQYQDKTPEAVKIAKRLYGKKR